KSRGLKGANAVWVASLFGGNWDNAADSGSRASNWNNYPWNSNENIGARGCSDTQFPALRRSRPRRPTISNDGQPFQPASANTLQGPVNRGVARKRRNPRPAIYFRQSFSGQGYWGRNTGT